MLKLVTILVACVLTVLTVRRIMQTVCFGRQGQGRASVTPRVP